MLPIESPRYILNQGYPELHFEANGRSVVMVPDQQRPVLTAAGWILLGSEFAHELPVVQFEVSESPGNIITLEGYTNDPGVARLFRQFLRDVQFFGHDFPAGPVTISDRDFGYWTEDSGGHVDLFGGKRG